MGGGGGRCPPRFEPFLGGGGGPLTHAGACRQTLTPLAFAPDYMPRYLPRFARYVLATVARLYSPANSLLCPALSVPMQCPAMPANAPLCAPQCHCYMASR